MGSEQKATMGFCEHVDEPSVSIKGGDFLKDAHDPLIFYKQNTTMWLLQWKPQNAQTSLELQKCFNTSIPTFFGAVIKYFGSHWPATCTSSRIKTLL